jgi:hypothetical protein
MGQRRLGALNERIDDSVTWYRCGNFPSPESFGRLGNQAAFF